MAGRVQGSKTRIKWSDPSTFQFIMTSYNEMKEQGWVRPPVRTLLYYLMGKDPEHWTKEAYNGLCKNLEIWRQRGLLRYGLFSDDSGGADYIPSTAREIQEQIEIWKSTTPMKLSRDGNLYALFVEHAGLVETCRTLFGQKLTILSSAGQIRHEHLYSNITQLVKALNELNGKSQLPS